MNYYKDYNVLIRKLDKAENKSEQIKRNYKSIYYHRLDGLLKLKYEEYLKYRLNLS